MAVKTWAELRTAFANNNIGAITAAHMRDLIDTAEANSRDISVTASSNGVNFRFEGAVNYQIASIVLVIPGSGAGMRKQEWVYPQAFASQPAILAIPRNVAPTGLIVGQCFPTGVTATKADIELEVIYAAAGGMTANVIAIGTY